MADEHPLLSWTEKQLAWVADALRRHVQSPLHELSGSDKADVQARVRLASGLTQDELEHLQLTADHLISGPAPEPRTLLCSLGPVQNLGRLAPGQQLTFALDGITLVYGDNGSGKTGYCRIAKQVCRSQTKDDLIGNVFEEGDKPPAEALIRYKPEGAAKIAEDTWRDGTPPPSAVKSISVFDSKNARFYVDKDNRIGFLPSEISLLERHAAHRLEMDEIFEGEKKAIELKCKVPLPAGYTPGGAIEGLLSRLILKGVNLPSNDEIIAAATWSDQDATDLAALTVTLLQDPAALASRYERSAATIGGFSKTIELIEEQLSDSRLEDLKHASATAAAAALAAGLAADQLFGTDLLPGVGHDAWKLMYEFAQKYVASISTATALPSGADDLCALCHNVLGEQGSQRIKRFNDFVAGEAANASAEAAAREAEGLAKLIALVIPAEATANLSLAEFVTISEQTATLATQISSYFAAAEKRRESLVQAVRKRNFDEILSLEIDPSASISATSQDLSLQASSLNDEAGLNTKRAEDVQKVNDLKDKENLKNSLSTVLARVADITNYEGIQQCIKLVNTQSVSIQITNVRRALVTAGLDDRIKKEIDGLDLGHIPFEVSDQSQSGNSLFSVKIKAPVSVSNDKILSEGEQRALALACFLAEVGADVQNHGLIIDDPVSSLDHLRIRLVAARLVKEAAKGKQVIIFTHNLLFYNEVTNAAASAATPVPVAHRTVTKSHADGFGLISEDVEPWTVQKVGSRIAKLQPRAKSLYEEMDTQTESFRSRAKDFYTDLRETWERLVEEVLLGKVVERYSSDVRTQNLKMATIEDEDYKTIFWAMKRVSEFSGHDQAAGKQIPVPTGSDMKDDLKKLEDFNKIISERSKNAEKVRKAMEKPPVAKVA